MKTIRLFSIAVGLVATPLLADFPVTPFAYVATAMHGMVYFKMVPRHGTTWDQENGLGIAYRVRQDGTDEELWRTEGWYSFEVYLSFDGNYLVAMGPWSEGREPKKEDLAVAFYAKGKLLKQYSTTDLVRDKRKVVQSVSHYRWLARDRERLGDGKGDPEAQLRVTGDNTFHLKTCDGIVYVFDMTTGEIKK